MAPPRIRKVFSGFAPDLQIDLKGPCSREPNDNKIIEKYVLRQRTIFFLYEVLYGNHKNVNVIGTEAHSIFIYEIILTKIITLIFQKMEHLLIAHSQYSKSHSHY